MFSLRFSKGSCNQAGLRSLQVTGEPCVRRHIRVVESTNQKDGTGVASSFPCSKMQIFLHSRADIVTDVPCPDSSVTERNKLGLTASDRKREGSIGMVPASWTWDAFAQQVVVNKRAFRKEGTTQLFSASRTPILPPFKPIDDSESTGCSYILRRRDYGVETSLSGG